MICRRCKVKFDSIYMEYFCSKCVDEKAREKKTSQKVFNHQYYLDHKKEMLESSKEAGKKFWKSIKDDSKRHEEYLKRQREYSQLPGPKEKRAKCQHDYYVGNKKKLLDYNKVYLKENKEQHQDYRNEHYDKNAKKINEGYRANYKKNKLKKRAYFEEYFEDHPGSLKAYQRTKVLGLRGDWCEKCGGKENLVFHRENYNNDMHGVTVCRLCLHRYYLKKK